MVPRRMTRVMIGAAVLGLALLAFTALRLALPRPDGARSESHATPPAVTIESEVKGVVTDATPVVPEQRHGTDRDAVAEPATREVDPVDAPAAVAESHPVAHGGGRLAPRASDATPEARYPEASLAPAEGDAGGGSAMTTRNLPVIPIDGSNW